MKIYLEYKDAKSEKFWEVSVKGKVMTTRWGKLDTQGQSKSKELESPKLAKAELERDQVMLLLKSKQSLKLKTKESGNVRSWRSIP